jgi:hypothetical protein
MSNTNGVMATLQPNRFGCITMKFDLDYLELFKYFTIDLLFDYDYHKDFDMEDCGMGGSAWSVLSDIEELFTYGTLKENIKHSSITKMNSRLFKTNKKYWYEAPDRFWESVRPPPMVWSALKKIWINYYTNYWRLANLQCNGYSDDEEREQFRDDYAFHQFIEPKPEYSPYSCWEKIKDELNLTEPQMKRLHTQMRNWFFKIQKKFWCIKRHIKKQKQRYYSAERKARELLGKFIFDRMMDTEYKIGRHFFDFRLKQEGIEYE